MSKLRLRNGDRIVFAGDSITDCGRFQSPPLGTGYVHVFHALLTAKYPHLRVEVFNVGVSGHTVHDLLDRWVDDVLSLKPTWVSILIGINDIHRALAGQPGYDPDSYYRSYRRILELTRSSLGSVNLILMSPFYISRASDSPFRGKVLSLLPKYIEKVEALAREFGAIYIDLHKAFAEAIKEREPTAFAPEPVHPNFTGHTLIALKILEALEQG